MGICSSCCQKEESRTGGEANERTHLLVDPVSNNSINILTQSDELISGDHNSLPKKNDEQSALSKILHEAATNVIDVSTLDSHDLEQQEYYERLKAYKARLTGLVKWSRPHLDFCLLNEVSAPEKILASDLISPDSLLFMNNAVEKITEALSSVQVEHREDLVVPFRIP